MATKKPKLSLVANTEAGTSSLSLGGEGLVFVSYGELNRGEQKRVDRLIEAAAPKAGVLAIARTEQAWDLRPVVALSGEDGPSIIRSLGPDVSFTSTIAGRVKEVFERLSTFDELCSGLRDWNVSDNELWYRRSLIPRTLSHELSGGLALTVEQVTALALAICEEVATWHSHGVIHGHITSSNVASTEDGTIVLLDAGIGAALLQGAKEVPGNLLQTTAPELRQHDVVTAAADIYGLGQIVRRLFLALRKKYQFTELREQVNHECERYSGLIQEMISEDPEERPSITTVLKMFRGEPSRVVPEEVVARSGVQPVRAQGRILKPGNVNVRVGRPKPQTSGVIPRTESVNRAEPASEPPQKESTPSAEGHYAGHDPYAEAFAGFAGEEIEETFGIDAALEDEETPISTVLTSGSGAVARESRAQNKSASGFGWFVAGLCCVLALVYYVLRVAPSGYETLEYNLNELRLDWQSKIPSRMLTVAEVALEPDADVKAVQDLIVASANNGEELPAVDIGLLRVAFDSQWEVELEPEDRRMAVALALVRLLGDRAPRDLGRLDQRHPGVILAITASAGENMNRMLATIPAVVLTKLPPPLGPAFTRLLEGKQEVTCADKGVQALARFQSRGVERVEDLALYLQDDTAIRLQALAILFSHNNYAAKLALEQLLNHPNIVLNHPELVWARSWGLLKWDELEESDQLFVLAGVPPAGSVRTENIAKLFLHPNPTLRAYAIDQAINRVKFLHPGAVAVLAKVRENPELLTPEQLARLADLLQSTTDSSENKIQALIGTEPPIEIMSALLLSTRAQKSASPLDTWIAIYLKSNDWQPSVSDLRNLSLHPDKYTRLLAYNKILGMKDEETARVFLETALTQEQDEGYREQLRQMIAQLQ